MIRAGVRGIRINLETTGQADPAAARERFQSAVKQIGARKLHIQMFTRPAVIAAIKDLVEAAPVTVVFDHFGGAQGAGRRAQPGFDALVSLVQSGKAYVKLSGAYRGSTQAPSYDRHGAARQGARRRQPAARSCGAPTGLTPTRRPTQSIPRRAPIRASRLTTWRS